MRHSRLFLSKKQNHCNWTSIPPLRNLARPHNLFLEVACSKHATERILLLLLLNSMGKNKDCFFSAFYQYKSNVCWPWKVKKIWKSAGKESHSLFYLPKIPLCNILSQVGSLRHLSLRSQLKNHNHNRHFSSENALYHVALCNVSRVSA